MTPLKKNIFLFNTRVCALSKREWVDKQQTLMEWLSSYIDEDVTDVDFKSDNCKGTDLKSLSFDDEFQVNNLIPVGEVERYGVWYEVDGKFFALIWNRNDNQLMIRFLFGFQMM